MAEATLVLVNPLGLHARAAAKVVLIANSHKAEITITRLSKGRSADGRSILSLLELGAKNGSTIVVRADGEDAVDAVEAIKSLIENGFGEI